jgi:ArsR family transcriptional regulator, arsenate/arsenite/antimonite-responsive transcriptional repressor
MPEIAPPPVDLNAFAERLKALAEPKRLQICHALMSGFQCNCILGDALEMAPNLISHHLRVLRNAGLIEVERDAEDGRWLYYSLNEAAFIELRHIFSDFFDPARIKPRQSFCGPAGQR